MVNVPLSVLDLVPICAGATARDALANTIGLAREAEAAGYRRYWVAEHHLNPGVAGTSPAVVCALLGAATSSIRIGSGAVLMGHRTALSTVEEFGLLDAAYPGRVDLGIGRTPGPPPPGAKQFAPVGASRVVDGRAPNGLPVPPRFSLEGMLALPQWTVQRDLLRQPQAVEPDYATQVAQILDLLDGGFAASGVQVRPAPGVGAEVELWVMGSSPGSSSTIAGEQGLRFAVAYHVVPSGVLDTADAYRAAFRPSRFLDRPYLAVSADVVVAEASATARELAAGYGAWVRSIRTGVGAIPFPSPQDARHFEWTTQERELVADRLATQFVGTPAQVADSLELLVEATEADELIVTTITHEHADRVCSLRLLAREWQRRGAGRLRSH